MTITDAPHAQAGPKGSTRQTGQAFSDPAGSVEFDQWIEGTVDQAKKLMNLAPVEVFDAQPIEPEQSSLV